MLQLIVHLPMFQINIPASTKLFFQSLVSIAQFELFPSENVYDSVFSFNDEPVNDSFDAMGYGSNSGVKNMGGLFLYLVAMIVFAGLLTVLKWPMNKFDL